jgi:predicted amidohydrolase YtcJ
MSLVGILALLALGLSSSTPAFAGNRMPVDLILFNGNVIPMTAPGATARAVAVRNGRIVLVGTDKEVEALADKSTRRVDLQGKTLLPGFIDAHGHIVGVAIVADLADLSPPPIGKVGDVASLLATMREFASTHPDGWLVGNGYDDTQLIERRHPTRQELDAISADRPIVLIHISSHLATLNSKALELADLLHPGGGPFAGMVRLEADGKTASGVIEEGAMFKVQTMLPRPSLEQSLANLRSAQQLYARNGLTTAQDGATFPEAWQLLQVAAMKSQLFIDVHALPLLSLPFPDREKLPFNMPYANHLRVAGVKIIMDGSPQGRTAWLSHPYFQAPVGRHDDYAGYQQIPPDKLKEMLRDAAARGWQIFAHVNGDAAIQELIDCVRELDSEGGTRLRRTIAIHSQTARQDQLEAMKELDIEPSFFASHTYYWGDWHREVTLGPKRADRISPQRDAFDLGLRPTIHNDSPVVPPDMIRLIWSAATRRTRSNDILGPEERVTTYEALQEVTANAAYEIHEEAIKGTLEPGKLADLVILDGDPLTLPPERLLDIHVVGTIKEGKYVFGGDTISQ